jgi:hypothetical protein
VKELENTGDTDATFLEMLKADQFVDVSLNRGCGSCLRKR